MNIPPTDAPAFLDEKENLWLQIHGNLPAGELLVASPGIFMIEHDPPGRVFINLTACMTHANKQEK